MEILRASGYFTSSALDAAPPSAEDGLGDAEEHPDTRATPAKLAAAPAAAEPLIKSLRLSSIVPPPLCGPDYPIEDEVNECRVAR